MSEWRQPYLLSNLRLGDRVVDVDRREEQVPALRQLVEAVDAGGGLLGDALDLGGDLGPLLRVGGEAAREDARRRPVLLVVASVGGSGTAPAFSNSTPLWTSSVASPPSSRIMLGPVAAGPGEDLLGAPPVLLEGLALPGEDRDALGVVGGAVRADDDGGGGVVLGGEDVAGGPADLGAEGDEGLDEHGGLDGHVQRAGDAGALERLCSRRTPRAATSGRASRARRGGSRCGRTRPGTGRRP